MATLTIFANFYICDEERFLRMKDSFASFKDIGATKWVINVRGKYKFDTLFFLHEQLGDKLIPYLLESKHGWFHDTQQILKDIDTDYVFFWIEDHLNIIDVNMYRTILNEMRVSGAEYLCYSWWHSGKIREPYTALEKKEYPDISVFTLNKSSHDKIRHHRDYIISMAGIFSMSLFAKIIKKGNSFLRQWPKMTPLNFEKRYHDTRWLPIIYALPKYELFASIDDDHTDKGYSLQSRGMYPMRVRRAERKVPRPVPPIKTFFRIYVRKYIPDYLYEKKVRLGNFLKELRVYLSLLFHGQ